MSPERQAPRKNDPCRWRSIARLWIFRYQDGWIVMLNAQCHQVTNLRSTAITLKLQSPQNDQQRVDVSPSFSWSMSLLLFREYGVDTFVMQIHMILFFTSISRNQESRPSWCTMNTAVLFLRTIFSLDWLFLVRRATLWSYHPTIRQNWGTSCLPC